MSGFIWNRALYYRVRNYVLQGYGDDDIVVFLGVKDRETIVKTIRKVRTGCQTKRAS